MAISKRLRYEILRRDNHTCRYCGATPPDAKITVDHVTPTALGGTDKPENLVAACVDCNTGKTSTTPGAPLVEDVAQDALRWARAMRRASTVAEEDRIWRDHYRECFEVRWARWHLDRPDQEPVPVPLPNDWPPALDRFRVAGLSVDDIDDAIQVTMRVNGVQFENRFRYFCGVAWRMVSERQDIARALLLTEDDA